MEYWRALVALATLERHSEALPSVPSSLWRGRRVAQLSQTLQTQFAKFCQFFQLLREQSTSTVHYIYSTSTSWGTSLSKTLRCEHWMTRTGIYGNRLLCLCLSSALCGRPFSPFSPKTSLMWRTIRFADTKLSMRTQHSGGYWGILSPCLSTCCRQICTNCCNQIPFRADHCSPITSLI